MKKNIVLAVCVACGAAAWAAPGPNIIFVLTDDLGYGDVGVFYQNARRAAGDRAAPWHATPQLDQLAAQGARMTNHYCAAPVCAPARASLLTGLDQGHANVRDNQFDKELEDNHTLATVLRRAGYTTAAIGKWGLQGGGEGAEAKAGPNWPAHPLNRGFDYYYGYIRHGDGHEHYPKEGLYSKGGGKQVWENRTEVSSGLDQCYTTDLFTARAKKWIGDHTRDTPAQPFFLYLAFDTPHAVLELPTEAYPPGGGLNGGVQWLGTPGKMINTAEGKIDSWIHPDYSDATYDDDHNPGTPEKPWPDIYRRYATSVRRIDDCVGDLVQLLKDLNLDGNTLIVFSSDNGPSIESYLPEKITPQFFSSYGPFDGIKRDCWEGGIRVPAIVRWPGRIPAGRVIDRPSAAWDWLPTLADAAGLPAPARTNGVSLLPVLTGTGLQRDRGFLYFEYQFAGRTPDFPQFDPAHRNRLRNQMQAIRVGDFMGVRYDVKSARDDFEIYNVAADPQETRNLAPEPGFAALEIRMKAKALQARRVTADTPRPYDAEPVPPVAPAATIPGLSWRYFEGAFPWVPDLEAFSPASAGTAPLLTIEMRRRDADFALLFAGYVGVPADGDYTFSLRANTGALLRLHEATVVDADFGYPVGTERSGTIKLQAGLHPIRVYYLHVAGGAPTLELTWSGPGLARQPIPADAFRRDASPDAK
jgi:arylsulfatase A-like enzyme